MNSLTKLENVSLFKTPGVSLYKTSLNFCVNFCIIFSDFTSGTHFLFGKKNWGIRRFDENDVVNEEEDEVDDWELKVPLFCPRLGLKPCCCFANGILPSKTTDEDFWSWCFSTTFSFSASKANCCTELVIIFTLKSSLSSFSGISRVGGSKSSLFSSSRDGDDDKSSPNFNCFFFLSLVGDKNASGDFIGDFGGDAAVTLDLV